MAWLSNIAGKAEDLLNRLDHNASVVLLQNGHGKEPSDLEQAADNGNNSLLAIGNYEGYDVVTSSSEENSSLDQDHEDTSNDEIISSNSSRKHTSTQNTDVEETQSNYLKESISQSTMIRELEKRNEHLQRKLKVTKDCCDNLKKIENHNTILKNQLDQTLTSLTSAQEEIEKYRSKIQKLLEDKEQLIARIENTPLTSIASNDHIEFVSKMIKTRDDQQKTVDELSEKLELIQIDLAATQKQYSLSKEDVFAARQALQTEKKARLAFEEKLVNNEKDLANLQAELKENVNMLNTKNEELFNLQKQIESRSGFSESEELESKFHTLTKTLIIKQNSLENLTTERNALRLQLERIENDYKKVMIELKSKQTSSVLNIDNFDEGRASGFFTVGPFDVGVTRRVKRAMSTLNAFSIRLGVFLRRYPVARVFLLCYIILLQIWVVLILFAYVPA